MSEVQDRNSAFGEGHQQDPESGVVNTAHTEQHGSSTLTPTSALSQFAPGQDAQSDRDYARGSLSGEQTPTQLGYSASTYAAKRPLMNTSIGL